MRLHHLEVTAFGPFAGTEQVDFDELSDAGLFLLTGPTGAGKTTLLDAVCFALYGSVPGVRGVKALKSQHAPDEARPEVVLEFSVRDRRFVIRRTPEWTRPKRRGTGFTTENASATLMETTTGQEHLLSSRAQEVGHFVGELIGMQSTQFVQVAMLPQGDFQKFLRATSQERHDVLQHLFRTDRFSRIEEWVHDHSRRLKERSAGGRDSVVRVLDTIAERANAEVPEELTGDALDAADAHERAIGWVRSLSEVAATARVDAHENHRVAAERATEARTRRDRGQRLRTLLDRRTHALSVLDELERDAEAADESRRRIATDDRAARCLPLLRMHDDAEAERARAQDRMTEARTALGALDLPGLDPSGVLTADTLTGHEQEVRAAATRLEALLPRETELRTARDELARAETELTAVQHDHTVATTRLDDLPEALETAHEDVARLADQARRADALSVELSQARKRADAASEAATCESSLATLRDEERRARDAAADARDRVQDLTARRLAGIAAELAGQLEDGHPCQVCGSSDHPRPAEPSPDAVTEAEQAEAQAAYEARNTAHAAATAEVHRTEERLEGLRAAAEHLEVADALVRVDELTGLLHEARAAETAHARAEKTLADLTDEQQRLTRTVHDLATRAATLQQSIDSHLRTVETVTAEIAAVLGPDSTADGSATGLATEIDRLTNAAEQIGRTRETLRDHEVTSHRAEEVRVHVEQVADEHGFECLDDLRSAALAPAERERLEMALEARAQASSRARAVLEDEDIRGVADEEPPHLDVLAEAVQQAEEVEAAATRVLGQHEDLVGSLARLQARADEAFVAWSPVREEFHRADSMAKLVRGMGADNRLQMRLSAYVLATRLDQVVAAANERLAHMRDQRYLLQRTGRAARKGAQAGLGLEVVDQWTGDVREPTTLSGGETFVVSLALALGLADVVTYEAGGTEIETLFVDEGFGTLDADTLDDVMDRLDELRAGGRAVGVVSHVSELRNRIPTQLHVEKHRRGSTVRVRTAVG